MKYANDVPKFTVESQTVPSIQRQPALNILDKMTSQEKRFYLPYLPNNQKRAAKSPPSVTFQKKSSRDSMLLKTTEVKIDTPIKSYTGNRYVGSHTITKSQIRSDDELSARDDGKKTLNTASKSNYFVAKQPLLIPPIKNPRSTSISTKVNTQQQTSTLPKLTVSRKQEDFQVSDIQVKITIKEVGRYQISSVKKDPPSSINEIYKSHVKENVLDKKRKSVNQSKELPIDSKNTSSFLDQRSNVQSREKDHVTSASALSYMPPRKEISINDFETMCLLGKGSFGTVNLVRHLQNQALFAVKIIQKYKISNGTK